MSKPLPNFSKNFSENNMDAIINSLPADAFLQEKILKLQDILHRYPAPFYIACSGGLDSRFLAFFAQKTQCRFTLIHADGNHIDQNETAYLAEWSKVHALPLQTVSVDVLTEQEVAFNQKDRCYCCKKKTFQTFKTISGDAVLCDGTHADDSGSYRPGLRALKELGIQSPLALANFSKQDIRTAGELLGLDNYSQKARPCLLTRFPYQTAITETMLAALAKTEDFFDKELHKIYGQNIPDFRIRCIDGTFQFHYSTAMQKEYLKALQNAANKAKMPLIEFKQLPQLSGYFDYTEPRMI